MGVSDKLHATDLCLFMLCFQARRFSSPHLPIYTVTFSLSLTLFHNDSDISIDSV